MSGGSSTQGAGSWRRGAPRAGRLARSTAAMALVTCMALASAFGCRSRPESESGTDREASSAAWAPLAGDALSEGQSAQRQRGEAARDALASQLLARLTEVRDAEGPAAAIEVCAVAAPTLAAEIGQTEGVTLGRTSQRLRNPSNTPPPWAAAHVASTSEDPAFFAHPDGHLGALWPIRLGDPCVTCHGAPEQIPPDVQAALAQRYPGDRATGFAPGGLRGWFWVEVPPR
jgi:hypothetical protein